MLKQREKEKYEENTFRTSSAIALGRSQEGKAETAESRMLTGERRKQLVKGFREEHEVLF